ncbi:MAG: sterol-binding protein, partial [Gammaproteobacteria bacterium]
DSRQVLLAGEVKIEGDVELGRQFKHVLDRLQFDWEEALAKISGDVLAHRVGHALREVSSWWSNTRERLSANGAEYFQQELWALPTRAEVEQFYQQVETLRDDVARLAARLAQLDTSSRD